MVMVESKKLGDFPAYHAAEAKLRHLKTTEADTKLAIRETEELLRRDITHALPDRKLSAKLGQQCEDLAILQRDIGEQERRLSTARGEASREVCEAVKPQHDAALREMALGIISANKAALTAARIREQLASDDVSTSYIPLVVFPEIGQGTLDPCSRLSYFVRECLKHGLLDRKEIPPAWRQHWGI